MLITRSTLDSTRASNMAEPTANELSTLVDQTASEQFPKSSNSETRNSETRNSTEDATAMVFVYHICVVDDV
jgi:hypothetical protein